MGTPTVTGGYSYFSDPQCTQLLFAATKDSQCGNTVEVGYLYGLQACSTPTFTPYQLGTAYTPEVLYLLQEGECLERSTADSQVYYPALRRIPATDFVEALSVTD